MQEEKIEYNQFDIVQIITSRNIKFLSAPPGTKVMPHGNWSIVGFVERDVIITKNKAIVKVPIADIKMIAQYNINKLFEGKHDKK